MPFRNLQRPLKPWERLYLKLKKPGMRRLLWVLAALAVLSVPVLALMERNRWTETDVAANSLPLALQELERSIGYGGFIHQFKNAVLRPDEPAYLEAAEQSFEDAQRAILRIQRLVRQLDREVDLSQLRAALASYRDMLEEVRDAQDRGLSIAEVDALVRISDAGAVLDLNALHHEVRDAIASWQFSEVQRQRIETIILTMLLCVLAAIIVFFQVTSRSAETERRRRAEELHARMTTLSEVTSGIAHDVNNLLATIFYALDLSMSEDLPEKTRSFLTSARKAVERGQALTGRLLSSTRPRKGVPEVLQLADVFMDVEALARPHIVEHNVTLDINLRQPGLAAHCDRGMLEDSLLNLVLNARDAMRDSGTGHQIRIEARAIAPEELETRDRARLTRAAAPEAPGLDPERLYLEITVSDDGPGMPSEVLERALEPFYTTKPGKSGNGLGLSMVHSFATGAEGDLRIDSGVGQGTVIHIILPRGQQVAAEVAEAPVAPTPPARQTPAATPAGSEDSAPSSPETPAPAASAAPASTPTAEPATLQPAPPPPPAAETVAPGDTTQTGRRLLLAEDEAPLRTLLKATLSGAGYDVVSAEDGAQALEVLRADPGAVDVVLTDISMPAMDGFTFAREARLLRPDLPVVYLTGYTGYAGSGQHLDVDGPMLRKPCPPDLLLRTLAETMSQAPRT